MSDSKIQVKVGTVEFSGEGNQDWLSKQLDKFLEQIPKLLQSEFDAPKKRGTKVIVPLWVKVL